MGRGSVPGCISVIGVLEQSAEKNRKQTWQNQHPPWGLILAGAISAQWAEGGLI